MHLGVEIIMANNLDYNFDCHKLTIDTEGYSREVGNHNKKNAQKGPYPSLIKSIQSLHQSINPIVVIIL